MEEIVVKALGFIQRCAAFFEQDGLGGADTITSRNPNVRVSPPKSIHTRAIPYFSEMLIENSLKGGRQRETRVSG